MQNITRNATNPFVFSVSISMPLTGKWLLFLIQLWFGRFYVAVYTKQVSPPTHPAQACFSVFRLSGSHSYGLNPKLRCPCACVRKSGGWAGNSVCGMASQKKNSNHGHQGGWAKNGLCMDNVKKKKKTVERTFKLPLQYPSSIIVDAAVTNTTRLFPHSRERIQHRTKREFVQSFSFCTVVWLNTWFWRGVQGRSVELLKQFQWNCLLTILNECTIACI